MIFENNNTLILILLGIFIFYLMFKCSSESFESVDIIECSTCEKQEETPDEVINTRGNFKKYCKNVKYEKSGKILTASCQSADNPESFILQTYSFMEPCRVLNYKKNNEKFNCLSVI